MHSSFLMPDPRLPLHYLPDRSCHPLCVWFVWKKIINLRESRVLYETQYLRPKPSPGANKATQASRFRSKIDLGIVSEVENEPLQVPILKKSYHVPYMDDPNLWKHFTFYFFQHMNSITCTFKNSLELLVDQFLNDICYWMISLWSIMHKLDYGVSNILLRFQLLFVEYNLRIWDESWVLYKWC